MRLSLSSFNDPSAIPIPQAIYSMTSIHPSNFGTQSDDIFQTKVLRPFLDNQGRARQALQGGLLGSFHKPRHPVSGDDEEVTQLPDGSCLLSSPVHSDPRAHPFHQSEGEDSPRPGRIPKFHREQAWRCGGLGPPSRSNCLARLKHVGVNPRLRAISAPSSDDAFASQTLLGTSRGGSRGSRRTGVNHVNADDGLNSTARRRPFEACPGWLQGDDPLLISYPEEPDDDRVRLPAHRIGDTTPEPTQADLCRQQLKQLKQTSAASGVRDTTDRRLSRSGPTTLSAPSLCIAATSRTASGELSMAMSPQSSADVAHGGAALRAGLSVSKRSSAEHAATSPNISREPSRLTGDFQSQFGSAPGDPLTPTSLMDSS